MQNHGNVKQECQAIVLLKCTALSIYCIACTLLDSYLQLIFDFRLHRGADPPALCCVLQPLLLWKCFPPATMQQSWVFVWTGFEGLGEKKVPIQLHRAGHGDGEGLQCLPCPTAVGPAPLPTPTGDFCAGLWVDGDIQQGSSWQV